MTQSTQMINQPQLNEHTKCIQECGSLPLSLANLCASYLFSNITIPLDLEKAENLPTLHFTAEDLTRLLNGSYGLVCLKGQKECDQVCSHGVKDEMTALNLNILKKPVNRDIKGFAERAQKYGPESALNDFEQSVNVYLSKRIQSAIGGFIFDAWQRGEPLPDFVQAELDRCADEEDEKELPFWYTNVIMKRWSQIMNGKPLINLLKIVETTRLIFVRYDSQALPSILSRKRDIGRDDALGYYTQPAPAQNVKKSTCALVVEMAEENVQDNAPVFADEHQHKWINVLTNQCRTSMLLTLRDDTTEFFMRDLVEDTQQKKARDGFIQKYIAPLKKKVGDQ